MPDTHHKKTSEIEIERVHSPAECQCTECKPENSAVKYIKKFDKLANQVIRYIAVNRTCKVLAETHNTRHPDRLDMEKERDRLLGAIGRAVR